MKNKLKTVLPFLVVFLVAYVPFTTTQKGDQLFLVDREEFESGHLIKEFEGVTLMTGNESDGKLAIYFSYRPTFKNYVIAFSVIGSLMYFIGLSQWQKPKENKELIKELEVVESHPRYQEFIDSNPENRHIYKEQTASAFYKWLNENDANQSVHTTRVNARV